MQPKLTCTTCLYIRRFTGKCHKNRRVRRRDNLFYDTTRPNVRPDVRKRNAAQYLLGTRVGAVSGFVIKVGVKKPPPKIKTENVSFNICKNN